MFSATNGRGSSHHRRRWPTSVRWRRWTQSWIRSAFVVSFQTIDLALAIDFFASLVSPSHIVLPLQINFVLFVSRFVVKSLQSTHSLNMRKFLYASIGEFEQKYCKTSTKCELDVSLCVHFGPFSRISFLIFTKQFVTAETNLNVPIFHVRTNQVTKCKNHKIKWKIFFLVFCCFTQFDVDCHPFRSRKISVGHENFILFVIDKILSVSSITTKWLLQAIVDMRNVSMLKRSTCDIVSGASLRANNFEFWREKWVTRRKRTKTISFECDSIMSMTCNSFDNSFFFSASFSLPLSFAFDSYFKRTKDA